MKGIFDVEKTCLPSAFCLLSSVALADLELTTQTADYVVQQGGQNVYVFKPQYTKNPTTGAFTINSYDTVNLFAEYHTAIFSLENLRLEEEDATFYSVLPIGNGQRGKSRLLKKPWRCTKWETFLD